MEQVKSSEYDQIYNYFYFVNKETEVNLIDSYIRLTNDNQIFLILPFPK